MKNASCVECTCVKNASGVRLQKITKQLKVLFSVRLGTSCVVSFTALHYIAQINTVLCSAIYKSIL